MMNVVNGNKNAGASARNTIVVIDEPRKYGWQEGQDATTTAYPVEEEEEKREEDGADTKSSSDVKLPWQLTIWAWVLLSIEVVVMGALYMNGGGRLATVVVKDSVDNASSITFDDLECLRAARLSRHPWLSARRQRCARNSWYSAYPIEVS